VDLDHADCGDTDASLERVESHRAGEYFLRDWDGHENRQRHSRTHQHATLIRGTDPRVAALGVFGLNVDGMEEVPVVFRQLVRSERFCHGREGRPPRLTLTVRTDGRNLPD